jgi:Tfp pilus assembly protein PilV
MTDDSKQSRAFTLVEILVTTLLLITGLAALAGVFSQGAHSNLRNRQRAAAATLLEAKMEKFKASAELPTGDFAEYLSIDTDGTVVSEDSTKAMYLRTANVSGEEPKQVTVVIYGRQSGRGTTFRELTRATTLVADGF